MRTSAVAVSAVVVLAVVASTGSVSQVAPPEEGTVIGSPSIEVAATNNTFQGGDRRTLTVTVANAGDLVRGGPERFEDRVTTARNVEVAIDTRRLPPALAGRIEADTGSALLGELPGADARTVDLDIAIPTTVPPGDYDVPLRISYDYTTLVRYGPNAVVYNDADREVVRDVTITVVERPRLSVSSTQTTGIVPGEAGTFTFTVENAGTVAARDVGLELTVDGVAVHFGEQPVAGPTTALFIEELEPGASRTISVTAGAYPGTEPGRYLVSIRAQYVEPGGFQRSQDDLRAGVVVASANGSTPSASASPDRAFEPVLADHRRGLSTAFVVTGADRRPKVGVTCVFPQVTRGPHWVARRSEPASTRRRS